MREVVREVVREEWGHCEGGSEGENRDMMRELGEE